MGLFSSEHIYTAHAGSSSLFAEDEKPDTVKGLILQATIGEQISSTEAVIIGIHTNLYARARSMIKYAVRKYVRGLPTTSQPSITVSASSTANAIERDIGEPIDLIIHRWGGFREAFFIEEAIDANYLNPIYFPWASGDPLDDWDRRSPLVEIPILDPDAVAPASPYYYADPQDYTWTRVGATDEYQVTYNYTNNLGDDEIWEIPTYFSLPKALENTWIVAMYTTVADPGTTRYWSYQIDSGVDPIYEDSIDRSSLGMEYLPIAVMMHDKVWYDDEDPAPDDELEHTTHRLLRRLALDSHEVKEEFIAQQEEDDAADDEEKSNAEVWDFFIQFSVPLRSTIRGSREYLYEFWKFIEDNGTWTDFDDYQAFLAAGATGDQPSSNMHISEGDDTAYHVYYAWSYIHAVTRPGRYEVNGVPLRGNHMHSKVYKYERFLGRDEYRAGIEEIHGEGTPIAVGEEVPGQFYHDYVIFTKQLYDWATDTYTYEQVLVMAPSMMYVINTTEDGDHNQQYVNVELFPDDPDLNSEFRVPIHIGSLKEVAVMHREEMLADALVGTVFLVDHQKVKWYQQTFFKWLIVIIVIIIIIIFWRYELLPTLWTMAGAATGATAFGLYALYFALTFVLGFLISFAGALIGGTAGKLFTIVGMVVVGGTNPFTNLSTSWGNLTTAPGWGSAANFLIAVRPFTNFGMTVYQDISMRKLEHDLRDFEKTAKEKQQQLQDAWDSLGDPPSWLDPMDLIRIQDSVVLESSSDFIERSLTANPGVLGYDLLSNFSTIALMLPDGGMDMIQSMFNEFERQRGIA